MEDITGYGTAYNWWAFMSVSTVINIVLYISILRRKDSGQCKSTKQYDWEMRWLALPTLLNCGWRSFFPMLYNKRFVLFDCWMSSIFIGRTLATIGEVAWIV